MSRIITIISSKHVISDSFPGFWGISRRSSTPTPHRFFSPAEGGFFPAGSAQDRQTREPVKSVCFCFLPFFSNSRKKRVKQQTPLTEHDSEAMIAKLVGTKETSQNAHQRASAIAQMIEELQHRPEPDMEKFPAHYYEDGMASLRLKLRTQQAVAVQHWQGNTSYTSYQAIQDMVRQTQG